MTLCYIIIYYINFILYYALLYDVYILLYLFQTISMTFSLLKNKHFSAFTHTLYSYVYIYRWFRMDRDRYMHAENVHAQTWTCAKHSATLVQAEASVLESQTALKMLVEQPDLRKAGVAEEL